MDRNLFLKSPPPLDPEWLAHEKAADLLAPKPVITDPKQIQKNYCDRARNLNVALLAGRDKHLAEGIVIQDTSIEASPAGPPIIPIRSYNPAPTVVGPSTKQNPSGKLALENMPVVIYYHGGGLCVGDLDTEDLTCRRVCKQLECTVYSVDYRLMPDFTADNALHDALTAFVNIAALKKGRRIIVMGSSSGGQLAAQVSQQYIHAVNKPGIHGVLLRGPVTCDATENGENLGSIMRERHTSMSSAFHTSLLSSAALNNRNRTKSPLPLEADEETMRGLPRHWVQVCTNDIYYSDGVCYAEALREAGVEVKLDVVKGFPHTFWLKAPFLDRAVKAEKDMIEGLRWLIDSDPKSEGKTGVKEGGEAFVPFDEVEFEKKFMNM